MRPSVSTLSRITFAVLVAGALVGASSDNPTTCGYPLMHSPVTANGQLGERYLYHRSLRKSITPSIATDFSAGPLIACKDRTFDMAHSQSKTLAYITNPAIYDMRKRPSTAAPYNSLSPDTIHIDLQITDILNIDERFETMTVK